MWDDGGGALSFIEWHDTKLDAACVFLRAEDGIVRCLPWAKDDVLDDYGRVIHTDPQCQNPVLVVREGAAVPQYSRDAGTLDTRCREPEYAVHRVETNRIQPGAVFVWNRTNGECEPSTVGPPQGTALYPLAEKVGPETFVAADQHPAENAGRLRALEVHGEDGSFQRVGIWDSAREERCSYLRAYSVDRCLPDLAWLEQWFADADCTTRAIMWGDALKKRICPLPSVAAIQASLAACGGRASLQLFDLASVLESGELFTSDTRSCERSEGSYQYYRAGRTVPLDTFGELVPIRVGHGRMKMKAFTGPDGARLEPADGYARVMDELANTDCLPTAACDETVLCKPMQSTIFADASCTTAAVEAHADKDCSADVPRLAVYARGDTCWNGQLLDIGEPLDERGVYLELDNGGGCTRGGDLRKELELRSATFSALGPLPLLNRVE